jgi:hypothetical protein
MKIPFKSLLFTVSLAMTAVSHGQTIEWGSPSGIDIVDSFGVVLDNTYIFELGAFFTPEGQPPFVPSASNVNEWSTNWRAFDRAGYNAVDGVFTSTVDMLPNGTSDSPFLTSGATSFVGLDAYIWVRNSNDPVPPDPLVPGSSGSQWFLARADSWVFPNYDPNCCGGLPIKWSLSDLNIDPMNPVTPVWGSQNGAVGDGERENTNVFDLQTHTFVPEPSSVMLAFFGAGLLFIRRRND